MRILRAYLRLPPLPGGMERHIALLSAEQRVAGHQVDIVFNQGQATAPGDMQVLRSINLFRLRPQALAVIVFALAACLAIVRRRCRYDVVHVHGDWSALLLAPLLRRLAGASVLAFTIHDDLQDRWTHRRLLPRLLRAVQVSFSTGHRAAALLAASTGRQVLARPSGVSELFFGPAAASPPAGTHGLQVLTVARLVPKKQIGLVLDIAACMPDAHFSIAGDGPDHAALAARVRRDGLSNVRLLGACATAEICALMDASHCLLLTSREEGTPTAALEGMARGLPVVSSPAGGIGAIIKDGVHGHVLPGDASPADYVHCLRALADPAVRQRMAVTNRRLAQDFRWVNVAAEVTAAMQAAQVQPQSGAGD